MKFTDLGSLFKSVLGVPAQTGRVASTIGYFAIVVISGMVAAIRGPALPSLAQHTQTRLSEISFLFVASSLGAVVGSLIGGRLYDRFPGHRLMLGLLLVMGAALALVPGLSQFWMLTAVLTVVELARGGLGVGSNTLLIWMHGPRVGPLLNGLHFFFSAGAFVAPIVIAQILIRNWDATAGYWLLALLIAPVAFWLLSLPSPARQAPAAGETVSKVNHRLVILVALIFFLHGGFEISFSSWIFAYAVAFQMTPETAAYLTSAFWGALALGRLLGIPVAVRFRPRLILLGGMAGCLGSLSLILLGAGSSTALWVGTMSLGFSTATVLPTVISVAMRLMTVTGRVIGWFFVGGNIGSMILPWLIGQVFEPIGPQVFPLILIGDLLVSLVAAIALISMSAHAARKPEPGVARRPELGEG